MFRKIVLILLCPILLISCNFGNDISKNDTSTKDKDILNYKQYEKRSKKTKQSLWVTYWDTKDLEYEIRDMGDKLDSISYFAAYFDDNNTPFIPNEITENFKKITSLYNNKRPIGYLTFVNDLILADNTSSLKDTNLLYNLFENETSIDNHIQDILHMVVNGGFDGIEIDYEAINEDMELWNYFMHFIDNLYKNAKERNILVRVVLEPNVPLDKIQFPKGPEYVIMCYNLHGYNTNPGAKASGEFIENIIKKAEALPGKVSFAIATGGYDFKENGEVGALTERDAVKLLTSYNIQGIRDDESQAVFFKYIDNEGINHEVWYADKDTIKYWISIIRKSDNNAVSLWRAGGNISPGDYFH